MSTPDSSLSPQERAAFAHLEAAASAADPHLAARLSFGNRAVHARAIPPRLVAYAMGRWQIALRRSWLGAPILLVGLALMVVSLTAGLAVGIVGVVAAVVGLRLLAHWAHCRMTARRIQAGRVRRSGSTEDS